MSKFIFLIFIITSSTSLFAKKIKFAVDMTGQTISTFGVHVMGNFQESAGYPLNFAPGDTPLTQEGTTDIYSIILDVPAFKMYEFRFVNGDQGYEAEYVPEEVRVGYDFNDNRWLYLDSLTTDTTFLGAIQFGLSSPMGKYTLRYKVDLTSVSLSSNGVHAGANYNSFSSTANAMYTFTNNPQVNVYEIINYVDASTYTFNYFNGNLSSDKEASVPNNCATLGTRSVTVFKDTVFPDICFNYCASCASVGLKKITGTQQATLNLFPNPATNFVTLTSTSALIKSIQIHTLSGQLMVFEDNINNSVFKLSNLNLSKGLYVLTMINADKNQQKSKLIIE